MRFPRFFGAIGICFVLSNLMHCAPMHKERSPRSEQSQEFITITVEADRTQRQLAELDWNGDGALTDADLKLIKVLAQQASPEFQSGPKAGFSLPSHPTGTLVVSRQASGLAIESTTGLSKYEQAVEIRWLVAQTRMGVHAAPSNLAGPLSGLFQKTFPGYSPLQLSPKKICDAVSQWDLSEFKKAGIVPVAVFDLDGTVWSGHIIDGFLGALGEANLDSPSNDVLKELLMKIPSLEHDTINTNSFKKNIQLVLEHGPDAKATPAISAKDLFYATARLMAGMPPTAAKALGETTLHQGSPRYGPWRERIFADNSCSMLELIQKLKQNEIQVYFLSAGLEPPVHAAARYFKIPQSQAIASHLLLRNGRYTGEVLSNYSVKANVLRQRLPNPPLIVVGNSARSDFGMMQESAGIALMVNPDPTLIQRDAKEANGRFIELRYP